MFSKIFRPYPLKLQLKLVWLLLAFRHGASLSSSPISRIGILTSGGDCPGLNACIRAISKAAKKRDVEVWGFPKGLPGLLHETPEAFKLDDSFFSTDMLRKGGSRLGGFVSSDFYAFDKLSLKDKANKISSSLESLGIDGIIATGGDSSLDRIGTLLQHTEDDVDIRFVGIPKSIDNDIPESICSLGFRSAVSTAADAIANVRDTAETHRRIIVVEMMGREAGFLTLHAGLAGGADTILLPEFSIDNDALLEHVKNVYEEHNCAIVAVSESICLPQAPGRKSTYTTADGRSRLGGSAEAIARFLAESLDLDARHIVLGHMQRGGAPNAYDKVMGCSLGAKAVDVLCNGMSEVFVAQNGNKIDVIPLEKVRNVRPQSVQPNCPEIQAAQLMGIYCGSVPPE